MNIPNKKNGFTLIETFVAITVLMIAVVGPMELIAKFYSGSAFARNQITASFLAQDGLETAIHIIQNNTEYRRQQESGDAYSDGLTCAQIKGSADDQTHDWLHNVSPCKNGTGVCKVDSLSNQVSDCRGGTDCPLYRNSDGFYTTDSTGGSDSGFWRQVSINDLSRADSDLKEAIITSTVGWSEKGVAKTNSVQTLIMQNICP